MLEEVIVLKVEIVPALEDGELDCCIDEVCVEDELIVALVVNGSVVVEVERLVEEIVEDDVCGVPPVLDVFEIWLEELEALLVLLEEEEEDDDDDDV
jgi:hypothetical protein